MPPDAQPTEAERETWDEVDVVLKDALGILDELQAYKGAGQEIREVQAHSQDNRGLLMFDLCICTYKAVHAKSPLYSMYIRTKMSWRNNIGGFKISSRSMFIWLEFLCSAQSRLCMSECQCDWYSCCHGYCCYTDTVAMEWHLLQNKSEYLFFLIHSKERGAFLFYVRTLSNYFNETQVIGNSKAHWGREKKHWLDVLPSVKMEKYNE